MVITGDMFNSDIITDTGKEVEKSAEAVAKPAQAQNQQWKRNKNRRSNKRTALYKNR